MTNRQLVDYYKVFKNVHIIDKDERRDLSVVLDSKISIQEIYETFKDLYEVNGYMLRLNVFWSILLEIFNRDSDEIEQSLKILCDILHSHKRYIGNMELCMDILNDLRVTENIQELKWLRIYDTIKIGKKDFITHRYMKKINGIENDIACFSINDVNKIHEKDIRAILLKNGSYETLKIGEDINSYLKVQDTIKSFDYDLAYKI